MRTLFRNRYALHLCANADFPRRALKVKIGPKNALIALFRQKNIKKTRFFRFLTGKVAFNVIF